MSRYQSKITKQTMKQEDITQKQEKNQSTETDPEMTEDRIIR